MRIFNFSSDNYEFIGESEADLNPEFVDGMDEAERYLHPAFSTTVKPFPTAVGYARVFDVDTQTWNHVEDHRGKVWYSPDAATVLIEGVVYLTAGATGTIDTLGPIENPELSFVAPEPSLPPEPPVAVDPTPDQIKAALVGVGLTQDQIAGLFNVAKTL